MTQEQDTMPGFWEPVTFRVGDRVRVRLSGECQVQLRPQTDGRRAGEEHLHRHIQDGSTGVVVTVMSPDSQDPDEAHVARQGHPYEIEFDEPYTIGDVQFWATALAAAELELIEAAS